MATFVRFNNFIGHLTLGEINLNTDTFKVYLTNATPNVETSEKKSELAGITEQNGYAATDIQNEATETTGTVTMTAVDVVFTPSGGTFGPFRYAVIYDDTHADDILMGYVDFGSNITATITPVITPITIDFGVSLATYS
jgi:hypothetical protein